MTQAQGDTLIQAAQQAQQYQAEITAKVSACGILLCSVIVLLLALSFISALNRRV